MKEMTEILFTPQWRSLSVYFFYFVGTYNHIRERLNDFFPRK